MKARDDFLARVARVLTEAQAEADRLAVYEITVDHAFGIWQRELLQRLANRRSGVPRQPLVWGASSSEGTDVRERVDPTARTENTERLLRPVVRIGVSEP